MLTIVNLNGNIHVRLETVDESRFVKTNLKNVAKAVEAKGYPTVFKTKAEILATLRFDEDGNLVDNG